MGDFCWTGEVVYCGEEVSVLGVERGDLVEDFTGQKHGWTVAVEFVARRDGCGPSQGIS